MPKEVILKTLNIALACLVVSCNTIAAANNYKAEADAFCELYNPSNWKHLPKEASGQEIFGVIWDGYNKVIKSEKFKTATTGFEKSDIQAYYQSVPGRIERLISEKWHCRYFDDFYLPSQRVTSLKIEGLQDLRIDPNRPENLVIGINQAGEVFLNNAALAASTEKIITLAVKNEVGKATMKDFQFIIYADKGAPLEVFTLLINTLYKLGISDIKLIDTKS
jgi:biopolymer transport protein ExbD